MDEDVGYLKEKAKESKLVKWSLTSWIVSAIILLILSVIIFFVMGRKFGISLSNVIITIIVAIIIILLYLYWHLKYSPYRKAFIEGDKKEIRISLWVLGILAVALIVAGIIESEIWYFVYAVIAIIIWVSYYLRGKGVKKQ